MTVDPHKVAKVVQEIADAQITPRFGKLRPEEVREKSTPSDLVTQVDEAMEAALEKALPVFSPGSVVIGEERAAADPSCVDAISGEGRFWIVDPLDGTRNFVRGVREFATIVAYVVDGETRAGWIYAPPLQKMAMAERGGGVLWDGQAPPLAAPTNRTPSGLRSIGWLKEPWRDLVRENLRKDLESEAAHCSAYAYLKVLLGEKDFKLSSRIHAWDHAAGALMLEEADGHTAFLDDGAAYAPQQSDDRPLLAVRRAAEWAGIADSLRAGPASISRAH